MLQTSRESEGAPAAARITPWNMIPVAVLLGLALCGTSWVVAAPAEPGTLVRTLEGIFNDPAFAKIPDRQENVTRFGATGDGKTLDTAAIQKTIDTVHAAGGGTVTFRPGTYVSGALFVKSNVELRLDEGVTLQAIQDDAQYPRLPTRIAGIEMEWPAALVNVYDQRNVRITGKGVIDGNGQFWWKKFYDMLPGYEKRKLRWAVDYDCERVRPLVVWKSRDVLLRGLTLRRAGFWTVTATYSDRVHVDGLVIRNNIGGHGPSSDGVDIDSSSNVLVENCDIDCNDDNFCLKAGKDADGLRVNRPTENVVVRNCATGAGMGLFTIGSETSGGVRHVEVYGLKARGTTSGIRFKSAKVRGGVVEDIFVHDIEMEGVDRPFDFNLNWYPAYSYPVIPPEIPPDQVTERWKKLAEHVEPPSRGIPEFRNVRIENVVVRDCGTGLVGTAYPEKAMSRFFWRNVDMQVKTAGSVQYAADWKMENVTIRAKDGSKPEFKDSTNIVVPESR